MGCRFLFLFCVFLSWAVLLNSQQQPPSDACKTTPYPKLCRSILSAFKFSPSDPYNYGKFTIKKCLKLAQRLSKIIQHYLQKTNQVEPRGPLEDCGQLADMNVDYLNVIETKLKSATNSITQELVDRVTSLLSGIVTNQQTCFDGLLESKSGFATALSEPIANMTRLYSVSLGLVTHAMNTNLKRRSSGFTKPNGVRQPLESLIKALRSSCDKRKSCRKGERTMEEIKSGGFILVNKTVIVGPYTSDDYSNITDAVAAAPNNTNSKDGYFVIYARQGYYQEYVLVSRKQKNIMLIGDGINKTVITGNHSFIDGWTTYNSSTFAVGGEGFVAVDVTFKNTAGPEKHQAVALRNNADLSTFYRCSFEGFQDTLYVHSLRQFYRQCDIYGTVDFIFGNAAAVFQGCNLYARKPMLNQKNAFTAQGRTDPNQNTGISIHNCTIQAAPDLASDLNSTTLNYLGRPWKQYSRTVYMQSYIGELIHPVGWLEWNATFGLDTLFYGEYDNFGPGANTTSRVQWPGYNLMNATQAMNFTVFNFTMGDTWLPATDIPFAPGLLYN